MRYRLQLLLPDFKCYGKGLMKTIVHTASCELFLNLQFKWNINNTECSREKLQRVKGEGEEAIFKPSLSVPLLSPRDPVSDNLNRVCHGTSEDSNSPAMAVSPWVSACMQVFTEDPWRRPITRFNCPRSRNRPSFSPCPRYSNNSKAITRGR